MVGLILAAGQASASTRPMPPHGSRGHSGSALHAVKPVQEAEVVTQAGGRMALQDQSTEALQLPGL